MQENTDQNKSEYGHFLGSAYHKFQFFTKREGQLGTNKKYLKCCSLLFAVLQQNVFFPDFQVLLNLDGFKRNVFIFFWFLFINSQDDIKSWRYNISMRKFHISGEVILCMWCSAQFVIIKECFSRFLNCTNGTKSSKSAPYKFWKITCDCHCYHCASFKRGCPFSPNCNITWVGYTQKQPLHDTYSNQRQDMITSRNGRN